MDRLTAMQVFVRVVEAGSFVKAAGQLEISTTAASRLVADLEAHLGTRLLQRTTRRLGLTAAGSTYFESCQQIVGAVADAEAQVGLEAQRPFGTLRVSGPVVFGMQHLAPLLAAYGARYPDVRVDIALADRMVDLVDEGFDVAIRIAGKLADTLVARRLTSIRIVVCAAPGYLKRHGTPRVPSDLARHNCLRYTIMDRSAEWTLAGPQGNVATKVSGTLLSNNGDVLRTAALAGVGIVVQPSFMVGEDLRLGRLVPVLERYCQPDLAAYAVYPTRRHLPAKVRSFVDFLAETLSDPPPWDAWMKGRKR
ncbi:MAG: LysR family transcriptional regulator [Betaproteobacteria bacterium]|nr:LysR family transcriptional regulator [Betaproteobacteria bacterium]